MWYPLHNTRRSLAWCRNPAALFVEEVQPKHHMALGIPWFGALSREQHHEALAVGPEIEVGDQTLVRKLFSRPDPGLLRDKRITVRGVIHHHDPLVFCPVEELTTIGRPRRH